MKGISQDFSDCGLHNDKYTKYSPHKKCVFRALIAHWDFLWISNSNLNARSYAD